MYNTFAARRFPWTVPCVAAALVLVGWMAIERSEELTGGSDRLVRQQIVWSVVGLAVFAAASATDYRRLARHVPVIYGAMVVALVAVYMLPAVNNAHRWIRAGGIGVQPSEFAKVVFILALARLLMHRNLSAGLESTVWPLATAMLPMMLILEQPDLGTSLIFPPILFAMLFAGGVRRRDLIRPAIVGILLLPLLWSQMSHEQRSRITALWEQNLPREPATADGFHLDQAKRMLAQGNVWGTIFDANADDNVIGSRLPEAPTDSIFCMIGERFGLVGAGLVLVMFAVLAGRCLSVAARTDEPFGRMIAVGVAALFGVEVIINTGMMVGLLPITGLALPLVSYGGSDLVAHFWALGLVASVARQHSI